MVGGQIGTHSAGVTIQGAPTGHPPGAGAGGWGGAAPHAGDPRPADPVQGLVPVHPGTVHRLRQIGTGGVLPSLSMTMASQLPPQGWGLGSMARTRAGDAGVDIDAAALRLSDDLTHRHRVPGPDNRTAPPPLHMVRGMTTCLGASSRGTMGLRLVLSL